MRVIETSPDDPVTAELLTAYFAERVDGFTAGQYRVASPDPAQFAPPGLFLRIDEDDGAPLACGGVREIEPDDGRRMEVKHLFVAPAASGSGVGRRLLNLLEAHARREGAAWLVLDTNRSLAGRRGALPIERLPPGGAVQRQPERDRLVREVAHADDVLTARPEPGRMQPRRHGGRVRPAWPRRGRSAAPPAGGRGRCATRA